MECVGEHAAGASLAPGPNTFTMERIQHVMRQNLSSDIVGSRYPGTCTIICDGFEYSRVDGVHIYYSGDARALRCEKFCRKLYEAVVDPDGHVTRLDEAFSGLVRYILDPAQPVVEVSERACQLLSRVPALPLQLLDALPLLPVEYSVTSPAMNKPCNSTSWNDLQVTSFVNTNVIRTALISLMWSVADYLLTPMIDTYAEVLETASRMSLTAGTEIAKQRWFLVRAFTWTSWSRCNILRLSHIMGTYIKVGFDDEDHSRTLNLRRPFPSVAMSTEEMSKRYTTSKKPRSMCGWAFELLRNDPATIGMDFRRFHQRYSEVFGDRAGRCVRGSEESCQGDRPDECHRFKGMRIENQSSHDISCPGNCGRLTWNEASYRSVSGARAVSLENVSESEDHLNYCAASTETLAISHVWSHGQGGRPEKGHGFNRCLHRRYVTIARTLGCNSYWMDTPCIPAHHVLRNEAISNINGVFEQSKATLVCDRDLMEIDVGTLSMALRESILITVISCDWNVRAWTFLEAFRGRESIYLLCKDNVLVQMKEIVETVHRDGSLEIGSLPLMVPHLLPAMWKKDVQESRPKSKPPPVAHGFLSLERSGSLLSHRAASRKGDDVVIWSLFLSDQAFKDASKFWKKRIGGGVYTSFLVSSAPRLKLKGFNWAPSSPTAHLIRDPSSSSKTYWLSLDGAGSTLGLIRSAGLQAAWLRYRFGATKIPHNPLTAIETSNFDMKNVSCRDNLRHIRKKFLRRYRWGALLQPVKTNERELAQVRGENSRPLVVVCGTNGSLDWTVNPFRYEDDTRIPWRWRGVYQWDMSEPLPIFEMARKILLV